MKNVKIKKRQIIATSAGVAVATVVGISALKMAQNSNKQETKQFIKVGAVVHRSAILLASDAHPYPNINIKSKSNIELQRTIPAQDAGFGTHELMS